MTRCAAVIGTVLVSWLAMATPAWAFEAPESKRLARAKDLMADEQWLRAIDELQAVLTDEKEGAKDEALYWLAHSLKHSGDSAGSLATIRQLEQSYPSSVWVKPAGALRLEIAVQLGRRDVLWLTAVPPPPPPAPPPSALPRPVTRTPPAPAPPPPLPAIPAPPMPASPAAPVSVWLPETYQPHWELRIQALRHLMRTDADRAIPLLKEIAFESADTGSASQALFVLAQSRRPEARETVLEVAKTGPAQIRVAAVRELGRFGGPETSKVLLTVYPTGDAAVKRQVVKSLGERAERTALWTIARSEADRDLRVRAIVTLGQAGGAHELRQLYAQIGEDFKRPVILGLFNARAEEELIHIADVEQNHLLRQELLNHLRLLGTPKAKEYLQKVGQKR